MGYESGRDMNVALTSHFVRNWGFLLILVPLGWTFLTLALKWSIFGVDTTSRPARFLNNELAPIGTASILGWSKTQASSARRRVIEGIDLE